MYCGTLGDMQTCTKSIVAFIFDDVCIFGLYIVFVQDI